MVVTLPLVILMDLLSNWSYKYVRKEKTVQKTMLGVHLAILENCFWRIFVICFFCVERLKHFKRDFTKNNTHSFYCCFLVFNVIRAHVFLSFHFSLFLVVVSCLGRLRYMSIVNADHE